MGNFDAQPASNLEPGIAERDPLLGIFSPGYSFSEPDYGYANPGEVAVTLPSVTKDEQPSWVQSPPRTEPLPIRQSDGPQGANAAWVLWPANATAKTLVLPDGSDIRAIWVPVVPVAISLSLGFANSAPMYQITTQGGEIVPMPPGIQLVTMSASALTTKPDIYVFITSETWAPQKTGVNGAPIALNTQTPYDKLILGTGGMEFYWPLSDPNGALSAADLGPSSVNATPNGGAINFGATPILADNATTLSCDGGVGCNLSTNTAAPGNGVGGAFSLEFWFAFQGINAPGQGGSTHAALFSNSGAGPLNIAVNAGTNSLEISNGQGGWQDLGILMLGNSVHYVCLTFDGTTYRVYVDGNLTWSTTVALVSMPMNSPCRLDQSSGATNGVRALYAKLAFYGRALTQSQIAQRWAYHL